MVAVGLVVAACVGAAAGIAAVSLPLPEPLAEAEVNEYLQVVSSEFADVRDVEVRVIEGPERSLLAPAGGVVTTAECEPGGVFTSGTAPFWIDGEPVVLLATDVPLWRDLAPGSKGPDVLSVQEELARLGGDLVPGDSFTTYTRSIYRDLVAEVGGIAKNVSGVELARSAWLPEPEMLVTACPIGVGTPVAAGEVLAELPSVVTGARLSLIPENLAPGERVLLVDDEAFTISEAGEIAVEDLDRLAATPTFVYATSATPAIPIMGRLALAEPVVIFPVPPRAIVESGGAACVVDGGVTVVVDVLASQLGEAYVRAADPGVSLSSVALNPEAGLECR